MGTYSNQPQDAWVGLKASPLHFPGRRGGGMRDGGGAMLPYGEGGAGGKVWACGFQRARSGHSESALFFLAQCDLLEFSVILLFPHFLPFFSWLARHIVGQQIGLLREIAWVLYSIFDFPIHLPFTVL